MTEAYPILEGLDGRRPHVVPKGEVVRLGNNAFAIVHGVAFMDQCVNVTAIVEDGGKLYTDSACTVGVCSGGRARTKGVVVTADDDSNVNRFGHVCCNDALSTMTIHNNVTVVAGGYGEFSYDSVVHCLRGGRVDQYGEYGG